jgi:hypothetical protein
LNSEFADGLDKGFTFGSTGYPNRDTAAAEAASGTFETEQKRGLIVSRNGERASAR